MLAHQRGQKRVEPLLQPRLLHRGLLAQRPERALLRHRRRRQEQHREHP
jgi:hypothetical protein